MLVPSMLEPYVQPVFQVFMRFFWDIDRVIRRFWGIWFLGVLIEGFLKTAADFRLPKRRKVSATYFLLKRWRMSEMLFLITNHR